MLVLGGGSVALSSGTASATSSCTAAGMVVDVAEAGSRAPVAGYSGEQLQNAAAIMNAAASMGLTLQAQVIGVMAAMGESGLRVLDHGDAAGPDSRGLFQQRDSWGSLAERMDPTRTAERFCARLIRVDGWERMAPTAAAHAVQVNADPDHYTRWYAPAAEVVQALAGTTGGGAGCSVGGYARSLARELVDAADAGRLRGLVPDHIRQIRWIAQGETVPDCGIDTRILQVIVIAARTFDAVGVSSINRKCTGEIVGAGTRSAHWMDGGGRGVDFSNLDGTALTGADAQSLRLIAILDPVMPAGARIGQVECRAARGVPVATVHLTQFEDSCDHVHLDVAYADDRPLIVR